MGKNILVTGGAGFIGSNFIPYFLEKYPDYQVINLDKLTYAGDLSNLSELENHSRYFFVEGDICDSNLVDEVFQKFDIRGVIHFAAESHVDNSIEGPEAFVRTNFYGTYVLLDAARQYWMKEPGTYKEGYEGCRFHHISTDEVYGSLGDSGLFLESTPYAPNSPYSASKAGSDFLVRSYFHTYGMSVTTSNCSNNFGPKQHDEKLIPVIIKNALLENSIPIYGDGKNIRDWLFVLDHCTGIDLIYHEGKSGETYNIGASNEKNNLEITSAILGILDKHHPMKNGEKHESLITFVKDRPGHDRRYAIDSNKIQDDLGWKPSGTFLDDLEKTVLWYIQKYQQQKIVS